MNKKTRHYNLLLIIILFLSACNLPRDNQGEDLSATAAAQTIEALLSATPANATPIFTATSSELATLTPISSPIFTSTPAATATPNCPLAQFITDVTIPDGTTMLPGQTFNKKWRLKNIGACAWNGYSLVFDSGESMNGPATKAIAAVNPGQEIDIDVDLKAPNTPGTYRSYWRLVTNGNVLVPIVSGYQGRAFYVEIKVAAPTNTSGPAFAVTSVSFTNTGGCGGFTATANITANGAGTVTYTWKFSDNGTVANSTLNFASAGTQSVSYTWNTNAVGTNWIDIFIVAPNNQQFGRAQFTCP